MDDGRNGCIDDAKDIKYIPLTSSVDNKQTKSNGNIDLKKQQLSFNSSSEIKTIE